MHPKQIKKRFLLVMLAFAVSAVSVILVPFSVGNEGSLNTIGYVSGILFWAGLLSGIIGYALLCKKVEMVNAEDKKIPGILRFFSNPPAKVADSICIVGIAGTVYSIWNIQVSQILQEIFLLCMMVGIYAHILLNGKIYRHIWKNAKKNRRLYENEGGMKE